MNYNFNMSKIYMNKLETKIKEQQARIDKAIEYIENNGDDIVYSYDLAREKIDKLLDILKGSDSNE